MTTIEIKTFVDSYKNLKDACESIDSMPTDPEIGEVIDYNFTSRLAALKENNDSAYSALIKFYGTVPLYYEMERNFDIGYFSDVAYALDKYFKLFEYGLFEVFYDWDYATHEYVTERLQMIGSDVLEDAIDHHKLLQKLKRLQGNTTSYRYYTLFDGTVLHFTDTKEVS